uniref:UDP-glucuronosyltransferase 1-3-like n=1 Tax=Phascolarctos cinereus TaxID=38626 RepID=A0A6P5JPT3_PHACI|nr:UDP-glucuronosyltransferase 1-3-like [Phascolarctos cinereus]
MATGIRPWPWALVGLVFCAACLRSAKGGKLLVIPFDGSHWLSMRQVVQELNLKGHESVVLAPELSGHIREGWYYALRTFPVTFSKDRFHELIGSHFQWSFDQKPLLKRFFDIAVLFKMVSDMYFSFCVDLVHNKELMKSLEEAHYDAVLTDPANICGPFLALYLSIPAVYFLRGLPAV